MLNHLSNGRRGTMLFSALSNITANTVHTAEIGGQTEALCESAAVSLNTTRGRARG